MGGLNIAWQLIYLFKSNFDEDCLLFIILLIIIYDSVFCCRFLYRWSRLFIIRQGWMRSIPGDLTDFYTTDQNYFVTQTSAQLKEEKLLSLLILGSVYQNYVYKNFSHIIQSLLIKLSCLCLRIQPVKWTRYNVLRAKILIKKLGPMLNDFLDLRTATLTF